MKITLKDFQSDYVAEFGKKFATVRALAASEPAAVLLNSPTGSGKTAMITAFIEERLDGSEDTVGDPELVFVWLTDDPELNKQTYDKMLTTSSALSRNDLVIIDAGLDVEQLTPGKVYFLNTQKLGAGTSFVKHSDERSFTLWETLQATIGRDPTKFVLIIDEAHKGTKTEQAKEEAETIVQKFLKGSPSELAAVPVVIGISATPDRFINLCMNIGRPLLRVDVNPQRVRESGLLKEWVDLYHPDESQRADVTMLVQAVRDWKKYRDGWAAYGAAEREDAPIPVLLVQVEDSQVKSEQRSKTDLNTVVGTLAKELDADTTDGWLAHAFQDDTAFSIAGHTIRHLAPSMIDKDSDVKVVLFKTSLNTGWDCPRAEVMVSFRTAKDETNIAQLVGRMVRAPLARRIDSNEHLNTVALYLPFYNRDAVEKVVTRLTGDPGTVPPTGVRKGEEAVTLYKATDPDRTACFAVFATLPTYTVPRIRPMKPVPRLGKLASLLAVTALEVDPVKTYRAELVKVLTNELDRLKDDILFKTLLAEASVLKMHRRRLSYGAAERIIQAAAAADPTITAAETLEVGEQNDTAEMTGAAVRAVVADENVDDLFDDAGRLLGEGLHKEYLRTRLAAGFRPREAKLELHALVIADDILGKINAVADAKRKEWVKVHKAAISRKDEKYRQAFRDIEGAGADPEQTTISVPPMVEWTKASKEWPKHLYVDDEGKFFEDFKSSWERKVVEIEVRRKDVVGWLRNLDRKPWSLCVPRKEVTGWVPFFPDFIFFRKLGDNVIADIIDPHLLAAEDMPTRAVWLANYANKHADQYGRIEMVLYESTDDQTGKRLDLTDEDVRMRVAAVTTREQLKALFKEQK